jgi:hypothetical protein
MVLEEIPFSIGTISYGTCIAKIGTVHGKLFIPVLRYNFFRFRRRRFCFWSSAAILWHRSFFSIGHWVGQIRICAGSHSNWDYFVFRSLPIKSIFPFYRVLCLPITGNSLFAAVSISEMRQSQHCSFELSVVENAR